MDFDVLIVHSRNLREGEKALVGDAGHPAFWLVGILAAMLGIALALL